MRFNVKRLYAIAPVLLLACGVAQAQSKYSNTIQLFKNAGASASFFSNSYGYAVFPTIGEGALGVGGAGGKGRVYVNGHVIGQTTMSQVSIGFQAGGKAFSQIIFFQDKRAADEFTSGNFEFSAGASAVAITAGVSARTGTDGSAAAASGGEKDADNRGVYQKGMAVFTIPKGGLMFAVAVAGQKFSFTPN
jgi:lipid-binding SYLF domain-containing protein